MNKIMKSLLCVTLLSACGVDNDRAPTAHSVTGHAVRGGHQKDLIRVNLGACGDGDSGGGLVHVDLGGNRGGCGWGWGGH